MLVKEKDKDKDTTGSKSWEPRHCSMEKGQGRPRRKAKSRSLLRMMKTKDKDNDVGNETKGDNLLRMMNASREYMNCIVCCSTSRKIFMICCDYCQEWYHRDCMGTGRDASNRIIKNTCPPCASISKLNPEEEEAGKDMAEQEEEAVKATGTAVRQQRRFPCGRCEPCKVVGDCGKCSFCLDKTKFGGQNKWRQKCLFRTCIRMASNPTPTIDVSLVDHNDYIARLESDPTTKKKKQKKKKKKKDKKKKKLEDKEKQKEPEKRQRSQQEPTIDEPQPKRVCFPAAEEDLPLGKTTGAKSATAGKTASKLDTLLIANKVNLINEVENCGTKNRTDIAAEWGISISELNGIMRKKGTVMEQFRKQCLIQARQVEEAVLMWCKAAQAMNILVTRQILEEKAKSLAKKLGFPNFTLSDGWLDLFKARNNVSFNVVARAGAAGLSDERKALSSISQLRVHQMVKDWLITDLSPLLVVYKPSNIFNANETGIFYRLLPDRLLAFKGKACNGGERSEERLTAMVCANMDGSEKLPLLVIGNTKKPQCLANVKSLPTLYEANKTAWMTSDIFEAWARNIDKMCQKKNRKIAIVIDSCPAHPHITGLKSVTLVFLSPLTAANLQPMEQGIIRNLKMHYRRQLITSFLAAVDRKEKYNPTVLDAMILLKKSWKMVKDTTISHCFKLAGFERKKTATVLDIETAKPDVDINAATEDKDLFDQLREAGMDIPWEITLKSYAAVDADVRCTTGLSDDAILGAVSSSVAEVNNVEDDVESRTPRSTVSIAEAMLHLDKLQDFALQNDHTEGMLDAICDIDQVIGLVRKDKATKKTYGSQTLASTQQLGP